MKKVMIMIAVFAALLCVWAAAGLVLSLKFGSMGFAGAVFGGFIVVPIAVRLVLTKLFKAGSRKLEG